jgi:hypothetical protein
MYACQCLLSRKVFQILLLTLSFFPSFSGGSDPKLALLHPRLLSVYSLQQQKGKSRDMDNFKLNLLYQGGSDAPTFKVYWLCC